MTWYPQSFADKIPMTNMNMRPDPATGYPGRTYRFYTGETVYKFGDGLSYTDFSHQLVEAPAQVSVPLDETHACRSLECKSIDVSDLACSNLTFSIHLKVRNTGKMRGAHTVLLFSSPPAVHKSPQKHLLAFEKVFLDPSRETTLRFPIDACKDLSIVDEVGSRKVALGPHVLHIGDLEHSLEVRI